MEKEQVNTNLAMARSKRTATGRKKHTNVRAGVQHTVDTAAPLGANYLLKVLRTKRKQVDWARLKAAMFLVEQVLGKATQKLEVSSPLDSYLAIMKLAELAELEAKKELTAGGVVEVVDIKEVEDAPIKEARQGKKETIQVGK